MIKSVGQSLTAAVEAAKLRETAQSRSTARVSAEPAPESTATTSVSTPAARMAAQGAPVDLARIARIKQAIASGNYPVDPEKIAEKMLDLDLPMEKH
ncbi:MAG: flagellar biosynthesis anti-sigma factor FlgM [Sphingomonadales bacterium]|nr:flagellar biosynthesis anti-sigma factor FlgM [Sphingomonadales bacterium]